MCNSTKVEKSRRLSRHSIQLSRSIVTGENHPDKEDGRLVGKGSIFGRNDCGRALKTFVKSVERDTDASGEFMAC